MMENSRRKMILQIGQCCSAKRNGFTIRLHGVHERSIAFEAMCRLSSDFFEKIVEWYTKYKDLQNLAIRLEPIEKTGKQLAPTEFI